MAPMCSGGMSMRDALVRLVGLAVDLAQEHLRAAHLQLEALAAHLLDEHRELQLAAAPDLEGLRRVGRAGPRCETLPRVSFSRRALSWREVRYCPRARTGARC